MAFSVPCTVGADGLVAIPTSVLREAGIASGSQVVLEVRDQAIVIRAAPMESETYSKQRMAEFLLNNATDPRDYQAACEEVRKLGLDPDHIPHLSQE